MAHHTRLHRRQVYRPRSPRFGYLRPRRRHVRLVLRVLDSFYRP